MTDLLADKQKKKGGGEEGDCDTFFSPNLKKKIVAKLLNWIRGTHMTELWANK